MSDHIARDLIQRLADKMARCEVDHRLLDEAYAYLATPEPAAGPTDEEILALSQWHQVSYTMSDGSVVYPMQEGSDMRDAVLSFARAILARYGNQPPTS